MKRTRKITSKKKRICEELNKNNQTLQEIADKFGCSRQYVQECAKKCQVLAPNYSARSRRKSSAILREIRIHEYLNKHPEANCLDIHKATRIPYWFVKQTWEKICEKEERELGLDEIEL